MCKKQFKAFKELSLEDRKIVSDKFKGTDKNKQKVVRLPAINSVWLLVPEGKMHKQITRAQDMIKNFSKTTGQLDRIISTEVPREFLQAAG